MLIIITFIILVSSVVNSSLFTGLLIFPSPSMITGESPCPDLVLILNNTSAYVLELSVGFESNVTINGDRKAAKYHPLIANLQRSYSTVNFVNLSMSALGILGMSSESFPSMLTDLNFDEKTKKHALLKTMNIAMQCTYYIFCRRNKSWTHPEMLSF